MTARAGRVFRDDGVDVVFGVVDVGDPWDHRGDITPAALAWEMRALATEKAERYESVLTPRDNLQYPLDSLLQLGGPPAGLSSVGTTAGTHALTTTGGLIQSRYNKNVVPVE